MAMMLHVVTGKVLTLSGCLVAATICVVVASAVVFAVAAASVAAAVAAVALLLLMLLLLLLLLLRRWCRLLVIVVIVGTMEDVIVPICVHLCICDLLSAVTRVTLKVLFDFRPLFTMKFTAIHITYF